MIFRTLFALIFGAMVLSASHSAAQEQPMTLMDFFNRKKTEEAQPAAKNQKPQTVAAGKVENTGELRSENVRVGFFGRKAMLPETQALDGALQSQGKQKFRVKPEFEPQTVSFPGYERGTIVIDTRARYLYLIESSSKARRYAIAVGREGLEFKGTAAVGDKQEWPRWFPTKAMQQREPHKYARYAEGMNGGTENPLGARAIYLYQGKKDTHVRIHGTNQPQSIGTNSSNGCFRMINEHVIDLYGRVRVGTKVVVI
jgi:lipoprotein-anchoring transpeptidase ErfK/SrfK